MSEQTTQPVFNPDGMGVQQSPAEHTEADMPDRGDSAGLPLVRLPAAVLVRGPEDIESASEQDAAERLRAAHEGWLERRGIDLARVPRLTMGEREYDLFRNAPPDYLDYARKTYGIPQDDQDNCQYALVGRTFDDHSRPPEPKLMIVNDADFGPQLILNESLRIFRMATQTLTTLQGLKSRAMRT